MGQLTGIGYGDYKLGLPTDKTDPNGLTTSTEYDGFGRVQKVTLPDGTDTLTHWDLCTAAGSYCGSTLADVRAQATITKRDVNEQAIRTDYIYVDGLGRLRSEVTQLATGGFSTAIRSYDNLGRVAFETAPSTVVNNGKQSFLYDVRGRLTTERLVDAAGVTVSEKTTTYRGRHVTATDELGKSTDRYLDVLGQVRQLIDPSADGLQARGITKYDYDHFGNLLSITDAELPTGNKTEWGYNARGFKISATVPGAGTRTFWPNSFGDVEKTTDGKLQTTNLYYDKLSRLTGRSSLDEASTWTWGTSEAAKNRNRLQSVTGVGYLETYQYDDFGRLAYKNIDSDSLSHAIDFGYSATTGQLDSLTYPESTSSYRLKLKYQYGAGILTKISDFAVPGTVFWQLNAVDARGNALDESLGNGIGVISSFKPLTGRIDSRSAGIGPGYSNLQDLTFEWDDAGNFKKRTDSNQAGLDEEFFYDGLNRLDYSRRNGVDNEKLSYSTTGNVTATQRAPLVEYAPARPYAIWRYTTYCGCNCEHVWEYFYDSNGNMASRKKDNVTDRTVSWKSFDMPATITQVELTRFRGRYRVWDTSDLGQHSPFEVDG